MASQPSVQPLAPNAQLHMGPAVSQGMVISGQTARDSSHVQNGHVFVTNHYMPPSLRKGEVLAWLSNIHKPQSLLDEIIDDALRIQIRGERGSTDGLLDHELLRSDEFVQWSSGDDRCCELWCWGAAGVGKSVFASIAVRTLQRQHRVVYLFFQHGSPYTIEQYLELVLRQIIGDGELPESLMELWTACNGGKQAPTEKELATLIDTLMSDCQLWVVLDGLDEVDPMLGRLLLRRLYGTKTAPRFLITSRKMRWLDNLAQNYVQLEVKAHRKDIRRFIRRAIDANVGLRAWCIENRGLENDILMGIQEASHGIFLLARLHMESLMCEMTVRKVRQTLQTLPGTVDERYKTTLERIQRMEDKERHLALEVLSWVVFTLRPLRVDELQHALAVSPGQTMLDESHLPRPDTISAVCLGLVSVGKTVALVHLTAVQYFRHLWRCDVHDHQAKISRACIAYLSLPALYCRPDHMRRLALPPGDSRHRSPAPGQLTFLQKCRSYPFVWYAVLKLQCHLRSIQTREPQPDILHELETFLQDATKRTFYVEALVGFGVLTNPVYPRSIINLAATSPEEKTMLACLLEQRPEVAFAHYPMIGKVTQPSLTEKRLAKHGSSAPVPLGLALCGTRGELVKTGEYNHLCTSDSRNEDSNDYDGRNDENEDHEDDEKHQDEGDDDDDFGIVRLTGTARRNKLENARDLDDEMLRASRQTTMDQFVRRRYEEYAEARGGHSHLQLHARVDIANQIYREATAELETGLHVAARLGWEPAIDSLLASEEGLSSMRAADAWGQTPLQVAVRLKHWEFAGRLLERGAYCDFHLLEDHRLLCYMLHHDRHDQARKIISNVAGRQGRPSRLGLCISQVLRWVMGVLRRVLAVNVILSLLDVYMLPQSRLVPSPDRQAPNARVDPSYQCGVELLEAVTQSDTLKITRILADQGRALKEIPKSHVLYQFCHTALFLAISLDSAASLQSLIDGGAPLRARGFNDDTLLHFATRRNRVECAQVLISCKIELEVRNMQGFTAWGSSLFAVNKEVLDLLSRSGARPDPKGDGGVSCLYFEVADGRCDAVESILSLDMVDPSIQTCYGWTPLHWAMANLRIVRLLVEAGADVNALSDTGRTPLDMLPSHGQPYGEVYDYMRRNGAKFSSEL